ncbi:MAG: hypothetical protein WA117_14095 [Verrucomicrobiia bacterium]
MTVPDVRVSDCHRLFEGRLTIHRLTAKHCQLGELLTVSAGIATKLFFGSWVSLKSGCAQTSAGAFVAVSPHLEFNTNPSG